MSFDRNWTAEVLAAPPMIAPARQFTWPYNIAGEEDALARGALRVLVRPPGGSRAGGAFLLTCALGFKDPGMPSGVYACPDPDWICAVAGGYAYLAPIAAPEECTLLDLKPVVAVEAAEAAGLLLFIGFTSIAAWGREGLRWQTGRLSWEGLRIASVGAEKVIGFGWDLMADREVEFQVDLRTGTFTGGGYRR